MNWRIKTTLLGAALLLLGCSSENGEKQEFTSIIEGTTIQVPALTGGRINQIYVDAGTEVRENSPLMQIDTLEISLQRSELRGALAELRAQEAIAGTQLKKSGEDRDYLAQKHQRFEELFAAKSINRQTLDDLKNKLDAAESALLLAKQQFKTLDARRVQLSAKEDLIAKKIKDATILAPINGVITEKYFEPGEAVGPMQPVMEIVDLSRVWLKIYLPETMLGKVKIGQRATILPDGMEREFSGRISWINAKSEFSPKNILTTETRTSLVYAAKIEIENPDGILKQGMPVEIKL